MTFVNTGNRHIPHFTGLGNVKGGKKNQTLKGGSHGYGFTKGSASIMAGPGRAHMSAYKDCGLTPSTSMGAGNPGGYIGTNKIQRGAGQNRISNIVMDIKQALSNIMKNPINNLFPKFAQAGGTRRRKGKKGRSRKGKKGRSRKGKRGRSRKGKNGRSGKRSRKQRGGYSQFGSNIPLTPSLQTAVGPARGSWEGQLAAPPTYKQTNNCNDNYNHFLGK